MTFKQSSLLQINRAQSHETFVYLLGILLSLFQLQPFISLCDALGSTEQAEWGGGEGGRERARQTENNCHQSPSPSLQINIAGVLSWRVHVAISEAGQQCLQDLLHYSGSTNKRSSSAIIYLNQSAGMSHHHRHRRGARFHFHPVRLQEGEARGGSQCVG